MMEFLEAHWLEFYSDWFEWTQDNLDAGSEPQDILEIMLKAGVPEGFAQLMLQAAASDEEISPEDGMMFTETEHYDRRVLY
jgi:hypothetical protein